jgi:hypothetical protein
MAPEHAPTATLLDSESPVAWTFPAGVVLLAATFIGLIVFAFYPRTGPPACEMQLRTLLTFAVPAGIGGVLTPLALTRVSPAIRAVSAVVLGLAATAIVWSAVTNLFPSFC